MSPHWNETSPWARTYDVPRGTCPRCRSSQVLHLIIGLPGPDDEELLTPDWVLWPGCMHPGHDRECPDCGLHWTAADVREQASVRLVGEGGRELALSLVPQEQPSYGADPVVDVDLVTPGRLVRHLSLPIPEDLIGSLAHALIAATLPGADGCVEGARLAFDVTDVDAHSIELTVAVETYLDADAPAEDRLVMRVPRSSLVDAAHALVLLLDEARDAWLLFPEE